MNVEKEGYSANVSAPERINVICVGNPLHGNDGVGFKVFQYLNKICLPSTVRMIDGGIGGLVLIPFFKHCDRVILVDLMLNHENSEPIQVIPNFADDYEVISRSSTSAAEHGGDVINLLQYIPVLLPKVPQVDLIAVSTGCIEHFTSEVDDKIQSMLPAICDAVLSCLSGNERP